MKKLVSALLAAVTVLSLFAGCAGQPSQPSTTPTTTSTTTPASTTPASTPPAEKVKLEYWTWLANEDAVTAFNESQDKVEIVKTQMAHADINNKLTVALSAGTGAPDLYQTTHRYFTQFKESGKMYDMTSDLLEEIDGFSESLQELVTYEGKIYGLPADVSPAVMWYRQDIFTENGIGEINTFNDLTAAAETLKGKGIYLMPIFNPAGSWGANAVGMLLGSRGGNYFTQDGKVIKNNKDLEVVLTWLDEMVDKGYAESLTYFTPEFWGEFKAGKLAAWIMNVAEGANLKKNAPELSGKWSVMNVPRWDDKASAYTGFWGGTVIAIPDQSENKQLAVPFVKWLAGTVEGQVWAGKTWNAVPALTEAYSDPFFSQGDPYFSNECVYTKINDTLPFYYYDWAVTEKLIGEQLDLMFAGKQDPVATARAMENAIAAETGR